METKTEFSNIEKIILGIKAEYYHNTLDVFEILDTLKVDINDLENPNYEILLDVLYKPVLGRLIVLPEEIFINNIISELISKKYVALFSNYHDAINDIKFSYENFNQDWWDEFISKSNFNFNTL